MDTFLFLKAKDTLATLQKTDRRTMAIIRHMRRSAFSAGRPGSLITEIVWKAGESELMCLHGGLRLCRLAGGSRPYIGRKDK